MIRARFVLAASLGLATCGVGAPAPDCPATPVVIAHRGDSGHAPEHTFAAYDRAVELGADYIEQDLQLTRDGVLVALHDETLDRTARGPADDCRGPVHAKTWAQLERCDVGAWFGPEARYAGQRIPRLDAILERYRGRTRFYIETKHPEHAPGMEEALLAALERGGLLPAGEDERRVVVQSFSSASLERIHRLEPRLPLVLLFERESKAGPIAPRLAAASAWATGIGPHHGDVDAELLAAAHARELVVHPYTLNDEAEMRRLRDLGVDGAFTDHPARLLEVRCEARP